MEKRYVLAVDQSTSSTKGFLFDRSGTITGSHALSHQTYYPRPGWVEHDPQEIFENVLTVVFELLSNNGIQHEEVAVIALTNQRETTVVWDRETGEPICNAPVWQCTRSARICDDLVAAGAGEVVKRKTGYLVVPSPPGSKIKWMMNHVDGAREKAKAGQLLYGQMDSWILWKLTGGRVHATDYSNASRSILYDINKLQWDPELMAMFEVDPSMVPKVKFSDEVFGYTDKSLGFASEIPISGVMGDSHAALFGHQCTEPGMAKITYGTGSSIMVNIGHQPKDSTGGLVTSIGWAQDSKVYYVFEGNVNFAGATVDWVKNGLGLFEDGADLERLVNSVDSSEGVHIVPAFAGLGAPYWDNNARAAILGMTMGTTKGHVARAAIESIAYQVAEILEIMTDQSGSGVAELRVDGGPTANATLMQFQADLVGVPLRVSDSEDASALGSGLMAGLAVGFWKNMDEIRAMYRSVSTYETKSTAEHTSNLMSAWRSAVRRILTT